MARSVKNATKQRKRKTKGSVEMSLHTAIKAGEQRLIHDRLSQVWLIDLELGKLSRQRADLVGELTELVGHDKALPETEAYAVQATFLNRFQPVKLRVARSLLLR
jgi:hypothetical protein